MSYMTLDLDWSDQSIPNGTKVPVMVTGVLVKPSSANDGSMVIHWDFTVTAGDYEGQVLKMYSSLKPNVRFRLESVFSALKEPMVEKTDGMGKRVKALSSSFVYDQASGAIAQPNFIGRVCVGVVATEPNRAPYLNDVLPIEAWADMTGTPGGSLPSVPSVAPVASPKPTAAPTPVAPVVPRAPVVPPVAQSPVVPTQEGYEFR